MAMVKDFHFHLSLHLTVVLRDPLMCLRLVVLLLAEALDSDFSWSLF